MIAVEESEPILMQIPPLDALTGVYTKFAAVRDDFAGGSFGRNAYQKYLRRRVDLSGSYRAN